MNDSFVDQLTFKCPGVLYTFNLLFFSIYFYHKKMPGDSTVNWDVLISNWYAVHPHWMSTLTWPQTGQYVQNIASMYLCYDSYLVTFFARLQHFQQSIHNWQLAHLPFSIFLSTWWQHKGRVPPHFTKSQTNWDHQWIRVIFCWLQ